MRIISIIVVMLSLVGCQAMHTQFSKGELDVQTRMSETIFLEPVSKNNNKIWVQVRNTSGKGSFDLQQRLTSALVRKGYTIVSDPAKAQFLVQANVLQVGKANLNEVNSAFDSGFGGALLGGSIAAIAKGNNRAIAGAGLAGAVIGIAADAMVKDTMYTIITDVQLSERASQSVNQMTVSQLPQGRGSQTIQSSAQKAQWNKYQTRIISTANRANLQLDTATPILVDELVKAIAGLM